MILPRQVLATTSVCAIQSLANANEVAPAPAVPINPAYQCPFTMLQTRALAKECKIDKGDKADFECDEIKVEAGCGEWRRAQGETYDHSGLVFNYFIENLERRENYRRIYIDIVHRSFADYLKDGISSDVLRNDDDKLILSADGLPKLGKTELVGDCG